MKDTLFFALKLGGYFNMTKTPASIIYILLTEFRRFFFWLSPLLSVKGLI